jgi:hypothetical protein
MTITPADIGTNKTLAIITMIVTGSTEENASMIFSRSILFIVLIIINEKGGAVKRGQRRPFSNSAPYEVVQQTKSVSVTEKVDGKRRPHT